MKGIVRISNIECLRGKIGREIKQGYRNTFARYSIFKMFHEIFDVRLIRDIPQCRTIRGGYRFRLRTTTTA
jgi:hypothetical protein